MGNARAARGQEDNLKLLQFRLYFELICFFDWGLQFEIPPKAVFLYVIIDKVMLLLVLYYRKP